ncbi:head-tail connector protein [Rhizobium ruizarguesonis]
MGVIFGITSNWEFHHMAIVDLGAVKAHLRILYDDDDTLIGDKIEAAQAHLESLLGYEIETEFPTVPDDLKQAVLALVGHWYENREATGENLFEAPFSVWDVVRERRSYAWE